MDPGVSAVWTSKPSGLLSVAWWASLTLALTRFKSASLLCFYLLHVFRCFSIFIYMDSRCDLNARAILRYYQSSSHMLHNGVLLSQVWLSTAGIPKPSGIWTPTPPVNPCRRLWPTYPTKAETQWRVLTHYICVLLFTCRRIWPPEFLKTMFNGSLCILCIECNSWVTEVKM